MLTNLQQMVKYSSSLVEELGKEVQPLMFGTATSPLDVQIEFFFALKKLKESGEELAKFFNVCEAELAQRINKQIDQLGLDSIEKNIDGVRVKISPETKWFISCNKDKKPLMIEWMKKHPLGSELVKEDVHPKSLEKFIKEEIIAKGEVPPTGMLSIHSTDTITTRKLPNK